MDAKSVMRVVPGPGDHVRVELAGDFDALDLDRLTDCFAEQLDAGRNIGLDLSGVTFLDSSALRALLNAHKKATSAGLDFVIVDRSPFVTRLFEIAGVDELFHDARPDRQAPEPG